MATLLDLMVGPLGRVVARLRTIANLPPHIPEPPHPSVPSGPQRQLVIPDRVEPTQLQALMGARLLGVPANGSQATSPNADAVVWVDAGDELVVYLTSIRIRIVGEALIVAIDVECDQSGRQTIVAPFAVGADAKGGILLASEALPRGPDALIRRWGETLQRALFASLTDIAALHASERGGLPTALYLRDGALQLEATTNG